MAQGTNAYPGEHRVQDLLLGDTVRCHGIELVLLRGLGEGDTVDVTIDFSREKMAIGSDDYELAHIKDIQFKVPGAPKVRSLKSNAGSLVDFKSMEPTK